MEGVACHAVLRFPDIVGHSQVLRDLEEDLHAENVSHAYLLTGPVSVGKTTVAFWFARQLLTQGLDADAAERATTMLDKLTHPDFLVLDQLWIEDVCDDWAVIAKSSNAPQGHRCKKPAAKTDTISIDDVRALHERLVETGTGLWRVCIIRSVERMQDAAANAFLKILEEPPPGLVFLLTTEAESSLSPTIISRTRVIHFHRVPRADMRSLITHLPEDEASFVLHLSQGAPGMAVRLGRDPDLLRGRRLLHERAASVWRTTSVAERLMLLKPLSERGEQAEQLLLHLSLALRERERYPSAQEAHALQMLVEGLETNAHRGLLLQRFALEL